MNSIIFTIKRKNQLMNLITAIDNDDEANN